jgi:murein DD-endopeptidase MepM/ murein hydrolase activator NlpD
MLPLGLSALAACNGPTGGVGRAREALIDDPASHHIDLDPNAENPAFKRDEARANGLLLPTKPVELPPPDAALKALQDSLSNLAATYPSYAPEPARLQQLTSALDQVAHGGASLSVREFCAGGTGLTRWLDEQPPSVAIDGVKNAKRDTCAQSQSYQQKDASPDFVLDGPDDGYGGLLKYDPLYPPGPGIQYDPNLNPGGILYPPYPFVLSDGHECVIMAAEVPSLPGQANMYELASYVLPGKNKAVVEQGMKLGARAACPPFSSPMANDPCAFLGKSCPDLKSYGANISLTYNGVTVPFFTVQAQPDAPVEVYQDLPDDAFAAGLNDQEITLTYQVVLRVCVAGLYLNNPVYNCKLTNQGPPQIVKLTTVPLGSMCQATYSFNEFTVNDRGYFVDEWEPTQVTAIDGLGVTGDSVFHAWARTLVTKPGAVAPSSSIPDVNPVVGGDWFAIHQDDKLWGGATHSLWQQDFFKFNKNNVGPGKNLTKADFIKGEGTDVLSGLVFPHIETANPDNGGKLNSYTCRPPRIVRDFVAFCSWDPALQYSDRDDDSLYLLPFKGQVSVSQGNNGDYSHKGYTDEQFAYDYYTAENVDGKAYAARAGVVTRANAQFDGAGTKGNPFWPAAPCMVDDPDNFGMMKLNNNCNPNEVYIVHQDGTEARYMHFQHHGVMVGLGWPVDRGTALGNSGNTGNSAFQHIHMDVQEALPDGSGPVSYSPGSSTSSLPFNYDEGDHPCHPPKTLQLIDSTLTDGYPTDYNYLTNPDYKGTMPKAVYSEKVPPLPKNCPWPTNNNCGGCVPLLAMAGDSCGGGISAYVCDGVDNVKCVGGGPNACGGFKSLQHTPGAHCPGYKLNGECWTCESIDLVDCEPCAD